MRRVSVGTVRLRYCRQSTTNLEGKATKPDMGRSGAFASSQTGSFEGRDRRLVFRVNGRLPTPVVIP